jgi:hypothetical protein
MPAPVMLSKLACLSLLAATSAAQSTYQLVDNFSGASFYDNFNFFTVGSHANRKTGGANKNRVLIPLMALSIM